MWVRQSLSRRSALRLMGIGGGALTLPAWNRGLKFLAQDAPQQSGIESFTGPSVNPHWNSVGPYVSEPQKAPLLLLTDRAVQLETPRHYFRTTFTPNEAFYVRWHLEGIPNRLDLREWKLQVLGNVNKPLALSLSDLTEKFKPVSVAAVN